LCSSAAFCFCITKNIRVSGWPGVALIKCRGGGRCPDAHLLLLLLPLLLLLLLPLCQALQLRKRFGPLVLVFARGFCCCCCCCCWVCRATHVHTRDSTLPLLQVLLMLALLMVCCSGVFGSSSSRCAGWLLRCGCCVCCWHFGPENLIQIRQIRDLQKRGINTQSCVCQPQHAGQQGVIPQLPCPVTPPPSPAAASLSCTF
jgi:hypothetical protein